MTHWWWGGGEALTPSVSLAPLHVDGRHFKTPDGAIYKGLHVTAFRSLELWLKGNTDALETWHGWLRSLGVTGQRVFAYHNPGHDAFLVSQYPDYYTRLPEYFAWMASEGFRVHFTAHLGAVPGFDEFLTYEQQLEHLQKVAAAMAGTPHLLEFVNEGEDNNEADKVYRFPKQAGIVNCRTRMWDFSEWEYGMQLDWLTLHPERKDPDNVVRQMRGLNDIEVTSGKPCIAGEPEQIERMRSDQQAPYTALALMFGEIMTIHGAWESLQQCRIPQGQNEREACERAGKLYRSGVVPAEASSWSYRRDEGSVLRYPGANVAQHHYEMNDGQRAIVGITEKHAPYPHEAIPGWKIVQDEQDAVYLERL